MKTPIAGGPRHPTPPTVSITSPGHNAQVTDIVTVTADAADNVGVAGVQFLVDGVATGAEDTDAAVRAGLGHAHRRQRRAHADRARERHGRQLDALARVTVNVANSSSFQNEILATGFNLPTNIEFLPDGRMFIAELAGKIRILPPPYTAADPTPFLQITNIGSAGVAAGHLSTSRSTRISPPIATTTSSTRWALPTGIVCRASPPTPR